MPLLSVRGADTRVGRGTLPALVLAVAFIAVAVGKNQDRRRRRDRGEGIAAWSVAHIDAMPVVQIRGDRCDVVRRCGRHHPPL